VPRLWKSCLQELQSAVAAIESGTCTELQIDALISHLATFQDIPPLPRATWKKLIVEMEV